jgi:DNA-directed RNA polymerase subunit RPC12/RpoP
MQQPQQPAQLNVSLKDGRDVACECGNRIFMPGFRFKKFSRLLTGQPNDSILPIELFLCTSCGKPLTELLPAELKEEGQTPKIDLE